MPPNMKPLILFGQDEAIFSQYSLNSFQWIGPKGDRALLPKTTGSGIMVSAFQSREFGFGLNIEEEDCSPFVRYFEFGANNDGYWNYSHMVIQFEDCVDCLQYMYPNFDYCFFFDHSSGHSKKRTDGLDASNMRKGFGGKQGTMYPTMIPKKEGYLGPYYDENVRQMIIIGQKQSMVFPKEGIEYGPWWMNEIEKRKRRRDRKVHDETIERIKTKQELLSELLASHGNILQSNDPSKWTLTDLQKVCKKTKPPINLTHTQTKVSKGWQGKPKGLLQVLWERGFIDSSKLSEYKLHAFDVDKKIIPKYSLLSLMSSCTDFKEEVSQLEHIANKLGVTVLTTTKFHAEIAGEGIEYAWGSATNNDTMEDPSDLSANKDSEVTYIKIEQLAKDFRHHRSTLDFDHAYRLRWKMSVVYDIRKIMREFVRLRPCIPSR